MKLHVLRGLALDSMLDASERFPKQLPLPFNPAEVDLDGMLDPKADGSIKYLGKAVLVFDNKYRVLADVAGSLCLVEVRITWLGGQKKT